MLPISLPMEMGSVLVRLLHEAGCVNAYEEASRIASGNPYPIRLLAAKGLLNEQEALRRIATLLKIPLVDLSDEKVRARIAVSSFQEIVSGQLCRTHRAVPVWKDGDQVVVAFANPCTVDGLAQFRFSLGCGVKPAIASEASIVHLIEANFPEKQAVKGAPGHEKEEQLEVLSSLGNDDRDLDIQEQDSAPIIKLIDQALIEGLHLRASDIHFDPTPKGLDIRYRIDGVMQHVFDTPRRLQRAAVARLKLLAGMNISEHRSPQDGRFRIKYDEKMVDLRVSCIPTAYGEKIVVRILRTDFDELQFKNLGMPALMVEQLTEDLELPGRIILVTGPTGSGKTTTLYTALKYLADGSLNIETVEDPIEYKIPGISQIQVNEAAHVTFASSLRSILRQDPDVIMVGEIRDADTATISLQAAQTGHLVLSTLHTNDAPSAIVRLMHLGCEPFVVGASLAGVLAQRLVRCICEHCKARAALSPGESEFVMHLGISPDELFVGKGCEHCRRTGYKGRVGIYSYLRVLPSLGTLIHQQASIAEVVKEAHRNGFTEIWEAARQTLREGKTSLEEVRQFLIEQKRPDERLGPAKERNFKGRKKNRRSKGGARSVVLVEDDDQQRSTIAIFLRDHGYQVIEATTGSDGLAAISKSPPDIIITGLHLPDIDGKELLRSVREQSASKEVPVMILTSADSNENEEELLRLGADDFLSRCRSGEVIVARLERLLGVRR